MFWDYKWVIEIFLCVVLVNIILKNIEDLSVEEVWDFNTG